MIRRISYVPTEIISSVEIIQTPLLRLLHGKKVILRTLSGKLSFYLGKNEMFHPLPRQRVFGTVRPKWGSVLLGSLSETKALGSTVIFAAALSRIGSVFGSGYYDRIISTIAKTAEGIDTLLSELSIAVPRMTATIAAFIGAAWVFAYIRNVLRLCRFSICVGERYTIVRHGLFTLYECVVVPNNNSATIIRTNASSLLLKAAPLYCGKTLVMLPIRSDRLCRVIHMLTGVRAPAEYDKAPLNNALFGHIAVPFGLGITATAVLVMCYCTGADPILRTLLWASVWMCLWYSVIFGVYMHRSGIAVYRGGVTMSARHGSGLYTAIIPQNSIMCCRCDRSLFQSKGNRYDLWLFCRGKFHLRLRNIPDDQRTLVITDTSFTL